MRAFDLKEAQAGEPIYYQGRTVSLIGVMSKGDIIIEDSYGTCHRCMPKELTMRSKSVHIVMVPDRDSGSWFAREQDALKALAINNMARMITVEVKE